MTNKKQYPYIAIFKCTPLDISLEPIELSVEAWQDITKDYLEKGINFTESNIELEDYTYMNLTQETYDFINTVSNVEVGDKLGEKYYIINNLRFQIKENGKLL